MFFERFPAFSRCSLDDFSLFFHFLVRLMDILVQKGPQIRHDFLRLLWPLSLLGHFLAKKHEVTPSS